MPQAFDGIRVLELGQIYKWGRLAGFSPNWAPT